MSSIFYKKIISYELIDGKACLALPYASTADQKYVMFPVLEMESSFSDSREDLTVY